jgi:hypothetical protein
VWLAANAPFACATEWGAPFSCPRNTSLQCCALGIISAAGLRVELARPHARLLGGSPEGDGIWRSREWGASAQAAPAGRDRKSCLSRVGRCFQRAPLLAHRDLVAARRSVSHARECPPLAVRGRLFHPARQRLLALGRRLRILSPTHDSPANTTLPRQSARRRCDARFHLSPGGRSTSPRCLGAHIQAVQRTSPPLSPAPRTTMQSSPQRSRRAVHADNSASSYTGVCNCARPSAQPLLPCTHSGCILIVAPPRYTSLLTRCRYARNARVL